MAGSEALQAKCSMTQQIGVDEAAARAAFDWNSALLKDTYDEKRFTFFELATTLHGCVSSDNKSNEHLNAFYRFKEKVLKISVEERW